MGFFDDWQEQDNSDYILATDYVEQLAIQHDSSIKATANYLLKEVGFNTPLYFKHPKGYFEKDKTGYDEEYDFDESPYTFIAHILENISDYKHSSFKTDASHIALRYADRYFLKKDLPTIQISDTGTNKTDPLIEANAKLRQELEEERAKTAALKEAQANGSFFMGTPTVSQTEPRSDKEVIELLRQEIADLESQLAQAKAELADTPINSAINEGQGDTLLILGAVMDCIKDVAKPNYTQQSLITAITDKYKNTPSLSASTLSKKFPIAKKHLNQRFTS